MKNLIISLVFAFLAPQTEGPFFGTPVGNASNACSAPTASWTYFYAPSAGPCGGSSSYAGFNELVAGANCFVAAGSGSAPTYSATGAIGSRPNLQFNGSSDELNTSDLSISTSVTVVAVIEPSSVSVVNGILGSNSSGTFGWRLGATGVQQIDDVNSGTATADSTTHAANTWTAVAVTYIPGSTTYAFYNYAGAGVFNAGNSGSSMTYSPSIGITTAGYINSTNFFDGNMALVALQNGVMTRAQLNTNIGTYIYCYFGF